MQKIEAGPAERGRPKFSGKWYRFFQLEDEDFHIEKISIYLERHYKPKKTKTSLQVTVGFHIRTIYLFLVQQN